MKYNRISENDRRSVFEAWKNEEDWKTVAKTLGINIKTAYEWLKADKGAPDKKGGSRSKMTEEMKVFLISKVEECASITLSELKTAIHNEFNTSVCTSTVKNWLDGELFTVKNVRAMVSNMNNQLNKLKKSDYMTKLFHEKSEGRTIICMDRRNQLQFV